MKNKLYRLLSALLALCMVVGTFTVIFTSTALHASADEDHEHLTYKGQEVFKGETMSAPFEIGSLATTLYASPEDKLKTMSKVTALLDKDNNPILDEYGQAVYDYNPWIVSGDYELYVQEKSGEIAVRNSKTGQVIFSNPYDVRTNVTQASIYNKMFSQIQLKYDIIKEGKSGELNSYTDAALYGNQIKVSYIKNGVCVEYTIGRADQRRLVPMVMEKYRWETVLFQKIEDEHIKKKFRAFYTLIDLNFEENPAAQISEYESNYPVLKRYHADNPYTSEGYDPSKEAEYAAQRQTYYATASNRPYGPEHYVYGIPYTGRMGLYVLGNAKDQEKNRIEEYIRSWAPEYNYDTLAYDHELVQYTSIAAAIPLFKMALEYRLDDTGFSVRLPANSITFDEDNFRLISVNVLPYMGAGSNLNTGYVFVPDGSGTLIRFEDAKVQGSATLDNGMLYGPDNAYHSFSANYTGKNEEMRYPVYGIVQNDTIVYEKNETNGTITEQCAHRYITKVLKADCSYEYKDSEGNVISVGRDGGTYEFCAICGHLKDVVGRVPFEHTGEKQYVVETNCYTEGVYNLTCTVCNKTFEGLKEEMTEHTLGATTIADTENHICYEIQKCTTPGCEYELEEKTEIPHTYEGEWTVVRKDGRCYEHNTCDYCGFYCERDLKHNLGEKVLDQANCIYKQTCADCGAIVTEPVDHEFGDPTYKETAEGLCEKTEICKNCGHNEITVSQHTPASNGTKKSDKENHYCYVEYVCEHCDVTYTEAADHNVEDGVCADCGFVEDSETVEFVHNDGKCYRVLYGENGEEIGRVEVDHVYGGVIYEGPSCTEWGYNAYPCLNCDYHANKVYITAEEDESAAPLGHDYQWDTSNKTSCLESYHSDLKCTRCGDVIDSKITDEKGDGHIYGEPECLLQETTTNKGIYKYVCEFCGHNHIAVVDPVEEEAPEEEGGEDDAVETPDEEESEEEKVNTVEVSRSHGFLAIMTAGSALASLKAEYSSTHPYIYTYMTVNPRPQDSYNLKDASASGADAVWTVVSERKYSGSYSFKYIMLQNVDTSAVEEGQTASVGYKDGAYEATYMGMAAAYRAYLIATGALKPLDVNENGIPLYLEAFGATDISSSFLTFPTVETVPLTTFEDLKNIVNELKAIKDEEGNVVYSISNINVKLNGFANGGMISTMPYKVEFVGAVGGNKGFSDFVSFAKENEIGVYPDFDFAYVARTDWFDGYSDDDHAVKTIDGRYIAKRDYDPTYQLFTGTGLIAVSASVYDYFYNAFNKNYSKFENMGVSLGSLGTDLNSDFDEDEPYNREDSREFTERLLANMKEDYGSIMVNGGNMYTIPYVDHVLNMSLNGSQQLVTSDSIPFMSMVLHGCVNYAGSATNMSSSMDIEILDIIKNGASPYFIIASQNTRYLKENSKLSGYYSVDYSTWKEDMIEAYKLLNENLKDVQNAQFVEYGYIGGYRLPDADENYSQFEEASKIVIDAIEKYNAAVTRYNRALALYERFTVTEVTNRLNTEDKKGILDILAKYDWSASAEDSIYESTEVKLTAEEMAQIETLLAEINEYIGYKGVAEFKKNITNAEKNLATQKEAYDKVMNQYLYLFNVKADENGNYNANDFKVLSNFRGAVYEENGKYVIACEGLVDEEGNPVKSLYEAGAKSIIKVGYDNGVEFYLNYNYYDVIVTINGEQQVIGSYDFIRVAPENK